MPPKPPVFQPAPPGVYVHLAREGQPFTLHDTATVRYGKEPLWMFRVLTPGTYPADGRTFGMDPVPGVGKSAGVLIQLPPPEPGSLPLPEVQMPVDRPSLNGYLAQMNALLAKAGEPYTLQIGPPALPGSISPTGTGNARRMVDTLNAYLKLLGTERAQVLHAKDPEIIPASTLITTGGSVAFTFQSVSESDMFDPGNGDAPVPATGTVTATYPTNGTFTPRILRGAAVKATGAVTARPAEANVTWEGPKVITAGGTYSGNYRSTDRDTPAVLIKTTQPVILDGARVEGPGDLIRCRQPGADVTIRNTRGRGINPNIRGRAQGRFADLQELKRANIHNNTMEESGGIYFLGYKGNGTTDTFRVVDNRAHNLTGQYSDGAGGYLQGDADFHRIQFVQFNRVQGIPACEIAYNIITADPREAHIEDTINIGAGSSGKSASDPIRVHHNFIRGAYAQNPAGDYSGGGIILGDGGGQYMEAANNTVLETSNYGMAVADGNHLTIRDNIILGVGKLADGTYLDRTSDAGIYIRDYVASTPRIPSTVTATGNTVGWGTPEAGKEAKRNDIQVSKNAQGQPLGVVSGNTLVRGGVGAITVADLDAAEAAYMQAVAGRTIGAP